MDAQAYILTVVSGLATSYAVVKSQLTEVNRRLNDHDECFEKLPDDYVPRRELLALLDAIKSAAAETNYIVRATIGRNLYRKGDYKHEYYDHDHDQQTGHLHSRTRQD